MHYDVSFCNSLFDSNFEASKQVFRKAKEQRWVDSDRETHGATDWPSNLSDVLSCWLSTEPRSASANLSNTFCYIIIIIIMSSCSSRSSSTEFSKYTNDHNISSVSWRWTIKVRLVTATNIRLRSAWPCNWSPITRQPDLGCPRKTGLLQHFTVNNTFDGTPIGL